MIGRRKASWLAAAVGASLAATCGIALAQGWGGHGGWGRGDAHLFLLARAAGVSKTTLKSTFHGNATLKSDFTNLRSDRQALVGCLVSTPKECESQMTKYEADQTQLTKDRLAAWQGVFAAAPKLKSANTVLGQLQSLHTQEKALREQKHQILKSIFASDEAPGGAPVE